MNMVEQTKQQQQKWASAIQYRPKKLNPDYRNVLVCALHFVSGDRVDNPDDVDFVPTLHLDLTADIPGKMTHTYQDRRDY